MGLVLHILLVSGLFGSTVKNKYLIYLSLPESTRIFIIITSIILFLLISATIIYNTSCNSFHIMEVTQAKNDGTAIISAGKVQTGDIANTTNIPSGILDAPSESAAQAAALALGAKFGMKASPKGSTPMAKVGTAVAGAAGMC